MFNWSDERIGVLTRLWLQGVAVGEIAKELGVGRNAVVGKAHRLGLPAHRLGSPQHGKAFVKGANPSGKPRQTTPQKSGPVIVRAALAPPAVPALPSMPDGSDIPAAQRCTLLQLKPGICKWPFGEPQSPDFFFCGGDAVDGFPYCAGHCRVAYRLRAA